MKMREEKDMKNESSDDDVKWKKRKRNNPDKESQINMMESRQRK